MPRVKHHRSSRRVSPPKDSDFDHEISLVDNAPSSPSTPREEELSSRGTDSATAGPSSSLHREPPNDSAAVEPAQNGHVGSPAANPVPDASARGRSLSPAGGRPVIHVDGKRHRPSDDAKGVANRRTRAHSPARAGATHDRGADDKAKAETKAKDARVGHRYTV